ncbi:GNAT family acetyltransferase [Yersinia sp. 1652 StPb PI]|uniref:GNAT family acetyltransferase n=1 Tax=unclassified Yersinia (in: enterobacteria) TaxID=2653513 RepID=UPI00355B47D0
MELCVASVTDIEQVMALLKKYHVATINEDDKKEGFVTTQMTQQQMLSLVTEEQGLFIAKKEGNVVAFVMAASWQFWSPWPLFEHMINKLDENTFAGQTLSVENSYQYGPICIDQSMRGSGVLQQLFAFSLEKMSTRFPILITFINEINHRSYVAHSRKLGLQVLSKFEFNNNHYYWMACSTQVPNTATP